MLVLGKLEEQHLPVGPKRLTLSVIQSDFHAFLLYPRGVGGRLCLHLGDTQLICHAPQVRAGRVELWMMALRLLGST